MFGDEYTRVEAPAIEQLQRWDWEYVHGDALSPEASNPERGTFKDVVLEGHEVDPKSRTGLAVI